MNIMVRLTRNVPIQIGIVIEGLRIDANPTL